MKIIMDIYQESPVGVCKSSAWWENIHFVYSDASKS